MTTTTKVRTLALTLDLADPDKIGDALALVGLGTHLTPTKLTLTNGTLATTFKLPPNGKTASVGDSPVGNTTSNVASPGASLIIGTFRTTTQGGGTATLAPKQITDAGGTAAAGGALLSHDGFTITVGGTGTTAAIIQ